MLRLGLDLGTNSIGWVLYGLANAGEPEALIDGGVLIHSNGRNAQSQGSNAAERREKRGPRRNRDRMLRRRKRVARLLRGLKLLPTSKSERAEQRRLDPLRLRAEALDRPLTAHELGRVLLTFVDRRGFRSNRKIDGGDDGQIRQEVSKLRQRMVQAERDAQRHDRHAGRTLGEYLWRRRRKGKTIRARLGNGLYPDRAMIEQELSAIQSAQAPHHPAITSAQWDQIINQAILFQRELKPVERGWCTLIEGEQRIYKAEPLFQRYRIWQEVLNLEYAPPREGRQPLDERQRWLVVNKLLEVRSRTFEQLATLAGLPDGSRFNFDTTARDKLDGDQTAAVLGTGKRFGKRWANLGPERQQLVVERLIEESDHETVVTWLRDELGLTAETAEAVAESPLPSGTGNLSRAAIECLLPFMEQAGLPYHLAVTAAGLGHHSDIHGDGSAGRLPYYGAVLTRDVVGGTSRVDDPDVKRYGKIGNPTVHIALGQLRRLFNAIADEYGKPDEVVVELARDLKQTRADRERDQRRNRENQQRNEKLRQLAADAGLPEPSALDMRKLRLWDEQGPVNARLCPFSGEPLSIQRVLSDATEVEHILPYSRTLDDGMNNTVVAMREANREKGSRTPYEAWGGEPLRYEQILARAELLPPGKRWRFQADAMQQIEDRGGFLERQLNDTRYLSRAVKQYLEAAVEPDKIWVTPGRLTAMLRVAWGLNSLLSGNDQKERSDHRHHLIDAAVVGMTSRSLLQEVARDSARGVDELGERVAESVGDHPWEWEEYRRDVEKLIDRTIIRHRPDHFQPKPGGTTGSLHNETAYGPLFTSDGDLRRDDRGNVLLVETKHLADLDRKKLETVRDHALRERLIALWDRVEAEPGEGKLNERFADRAQQELGARRARVIVRLGEDSLAFIRDRDGRIYKAYKTDGNAFMDIWLLPNGKTTGETVTRFDAHQPGFRSRVEGGTSHREKADAPAQRRHDRRRRRRRAAHHAGERTIWTEHRGRRAHSGRQSQGDAVVQQVRRPGAAGGPA
ncbi:MAG: type II CRISPR RNA-guided endonuclease Cas9 [Chloroflexi bacterium]|nr:type II CRISPR RNA-guided endonuclease Cas9 [Chloroflexota bacterium]MYF22657.1 type II CRISPR RNA-guided endonuclease Cas9 [Chloroflexota bacterium]